MPCLNVRDRMSGTKHIHPCPNIVVLPHLCRAASIVAAQPNRQEGGANQNGGQARADEFVASERQRMQERIRYARQTHVLHRRMRPWGSVWV